MIRQLNFIDQINKQTSDIRDVLRKRARVDAAIKSSEISIQLPDTKLFSKNAPQTSQLDLTKQDSVLTLARKIR